MKFGIREICNVVFRAKTKQTLGSRTFYPNEPVLYFDTLKTSNMEGAATTVYAQGGRGNPRLIAWEGERTLTFTMEDALLSPEGLSILTGAGLIAAKDANSGHGMFVHTTDTIEVMTPNTIVLPKDFACWTGAAKGNVRDGETVADYQHDSADIFVMVMDTSGNIVTEPCIPASVEYSVVMDPVTGKSHPQTTIVCYGHDGSIPKGAVVFVDYYVRRITKATQVEITADKFGGSYYIEADTLFRREGDNYDMPATFVIPNGKVQSNFTFAMASSGDPSTFTFTVDAMPDYTKFDRTHKILAGILIVEDEDEDDEGSRGPCSVGNTTAKNVTLQTVTNTKNAVTLKVTGTNVSDDFSAGTENGSLFNANGELDGQDAMVLNLNIPLENKIIRQTNPALATYPTDPYIHNGVKTKKYTDVKDTQYAVLLMGNDTVTVEVYDGGTVNTIDGTITGGTLERTYTINPTITFA